RLPLTSPLFPYTTRFRSRYMPTAVSAVQSRRFPFSRRRRMNGFFRLLAASVLAVLAVPLVAQQEVPMRGNTPVAPQGIKIPPLRSEEHTSELQSRSDLVC